MDDLGDFKLAQLRFNKISTIAACAGVFVGIVGVAVGSMAIIINREFLRELSP